MVHRLQGYRRRPSAAVRAFGHLRSESYALSSDAPRRHAPCRRDGLVHGRRRQASRAATPAARRRPLLLLAAREHAGDPSRRELVGGPHGRHQSAASGKARAVLAWSLRVQRGKGPRLPQDAWTSHAVPGECGREFRHFAFRRRARSGDARLSGRWTESERPTEREFWPRAHGIVHHGRWQLHRAGPARSRARLYWMARQ